MDVDNKWPCLFFVGARLSPQRSGDEPPCVPQCRGGGTVCAHYYDVDWCVRFLFIRRQAGDLSHLPTSRWDGWYRRGTYFFVPLQVLRTSYQQEDEHRQTPVLRKAKTKSNNFFIPMETVSSTYAARVAASPEQVAASLAQREGVEACSHRRTSTAMAGSWREVGEAVAEEWRRTVQGINADSRVPSCCASARSTNGVILVVTPYNTSTSTP